MPTVTTENDQTQVSTAKTEVTPASEKRNIIREATSPIIIFAETKPSGQRETAPVQSLQEIQKRLNDSTDTQSILICEGIHTSDTSALQSSAVQPIFTCDEIQTSDTSAVQPILTCDEIQTSDTSAVQPILTCYEIQTSDTSAVQPILTCDEIQTSDTSAVQPILTCYEIQTSETSEVQPILTCDEIQTSDTSAVQPILTCDGIQASDTSEGQPILTCVEVEVNDSSSGDKVISCKGSKHISLVQISPLPCSTAYKQNAVGKRKRKSKRSTVLTASPYKASLEEKSASRLTGAKRKLPTPKASSSVEVTKS